MDQLLTANVATNMYWLGRYLERVETALYKIEKAFNMTIDVDKNAGVDLYKKFGVELEYTDSSDFLKEAIYGDHEANVMNITSNARESAIISRIYINNSAFGEIIELDALFKRKSNDTIPIDYKDLDHALSLIKEIWGETASRKKQNSSDYFFKLGRLIEELDICIRFSRDFEILKQIIEEINSIFEILNPELDLKIDSPKDESDIDINKIHSLVNELIVED